jgi:LPXTG-motif cell wall-anchored protein
MPAWCWRGYPAHQPGHHTGGWDINTKENKTTMRRILAAAAVGAAVVLAFAAPAQADVTSHDLSAWDTSDTRSAGHFEVTDEGLHIWTDDNSSQAKVAAYYPAPEGANLSNVGTPAIDWVGTSPAPGLQIVLDIPGGTGVDGILVGEPAFYGANWWLSNSSVQALKDAAPHTGGGSGSEWYGTLAEWNTALGGDGWIRAIGFSLGSGVEGDGVIKSLAFFGEKYTFTPKPTADEEDEQPGEEQPPTSEEKEQPAGKEKEQPAAPATGVGGGKAEASLPVTGASVPVLGGVAALLLVGGGAAVLLARRRRTRFTA